MSAGALPAPLRDAADRRLAASGAGGRAAGASLPRRDARAAVAGQGARRRRRLCGGREGARPAAVLPDHRGDRRAAAAELPGGLISSTGEYDDAELPGLLAAEAPDVLLFAAQWPET
ncbi:MAG: hypothetical protein V9E95_08665 [Methanothrix soehngenii]